MSTINNKKLHKNNCTQVSNPTRVWSFGDSWCAGFGLNDNEQRFGDVVAEHFSLPHTNVGISGASLGKILHTFLKYTKDIQEDDIVLVIIPPDVRWYNIHSDGSCTTLARWHKGFNKFLKGKSPEWFIYHHSLFIYTFISICEKLNCKPVLAHNHGILKLDKRFIPIVNLNKFLDTKHSLMELLGEPPFKDNYQTPLNHDSYELKAGNELFIPNDNHPSEKGHMKIAELIIEKLEE